MKLHLPKMLFAAVLACIVAASPAWADATPTQTVENGVTVYTFSGAQQVINLGSYYVAGELVVLNVQQSGNTKPYFKDGGWTCNADVRIDELKLNNGYSKDLTYTFNGSVSGTGVFQFLGTPTGQNYVFNGDMSQYSGAMALTKNLACSFTFNGITVGATSINTESTAGTEGSSNANSLNVNGSTINGDITTNNLNVGVSGSHTVSTLNGTSIVSNLTLVGGAGTIINNGDLRITGNITINDVGQLLGDEAFTGTDGNGFLRTGDYTGWLIKNGVGTEASVTLNDNATASINGVGGHSLNSTDSGVSFTYTVSETGTDYYVRNGSVNSDSVSGATTIKLYGGTFNITENTTVGIEVAAGTINVGSSVSLNKTSLSGTGVATLSGNGTYQVDGVNNLSSLGNVVAGDSWTGTVELSDVTTLGCGSGKVAFGDINSLCNAKSWVCLSNCSGWLYQTGGRDDGWAIDCTANLELAGVTALNISQGSSNKTQIFSGAIKGSGDINASLDVTTNTFKFTGNTSDWTGKFKLTGGTHNIEFANAADGSSYDIAVSFEAASGKTLGVIIGGGNKTVSSTFTGEGTINLTVKDDGTKDFNKAVTVDKLTQTGGKVTFGKGITLTQGNSSAVSVALGVNMAIELTGDATLAHDGVTYSNSAVVTNKGNNVMDLSLYSSDISISGGALSVASGNDADRIVKAALSNTALEYTVAGTLTLNNTQSLTTLSSTNSGATLVVDGTTAAETVWGFESITVKEGKKLSVSDSATVSTADAGVNISAASAYALAADETPAATPAVMENVKVTASAMTTATEGKYGKISDGTVSLAGNITVSHIDFENSAIVLTEGASVTMEDVVFGSGTMVVDDDSNSLTINNTTINMGLSDVMIGTVVQGADAAASSLTISYDLGDVNALTGNLTINLGGDLIKSLQLQHLDAPFGTLKIDFGSVGLSGVAESGVCSVINNFGFPTVTGASIEGNIVTVTFNPNIPEPTTGALAMLALAGLAVRRRRK